MGHAHRIVFKMSGRKSHLVKIVRDGRVILKWIIKSRL
jgi:hypothetical protein